MTFPVFSAGTNSAYDSPYPVQRSVRFRGATAGNLSRFFTTPSVLTSFTWSAWVKRGSLSSSQHLFGALTNYSFGFNATDNLVVTIAGVATITTTALYRDPAAWYHIMYTCSGTTHTVYVNGVSVGTGTATNSGFNGPYQHFIGASNTTTPGNYFDGLITFNYLIDGQALTPSSFGAYNGAGIWQPIKNLVSYGVNGYFLPFLDNTSPETLGYSYATTNPELISNGMFVTNTTGWTVGGTGSPSIAWQSATHTARVSGTAASYAYQAITTVVGQTYYVQGYLSAITAGGPARTASIKKADDTTATTNAVTIGSVTQSAGSGMVQGSFTATATTTYIFLYVDISGTGNADFTQVSTCLSGYKNNWNPFNITTTAGITYDSFLDVPTPTSPTQCNYPVLNKLNTVTTASVQWANLSTSSSLLAAVGSMRMDIGKFYWEVQYNTVTGAGNVGVYKATASTVGTATTNVIGVRFDANAGTLDYTTDGTNYTSITTGLTGGGYFPYISSTGGSKIMYINFGQKPFSYSIPSGYSRLNSFALAAPVPISATAFAATLYTGNGATQTITNTRGGRSCYADIVWNKSRSNGLNHYVYDTVRGLAANTNNQLIITSAAASSTSGVTGFSSTGFSLGADAGSNTNTATYVSYQWNAGSGVSTWNFDGGLTRTATMTIASPCVVTLATNGFSAGQAVQFTTTGALPTGVTAGVTYYAGNILTNTTFNLYDTEANAITGGATGRVNTSGTQSGVQTCKHAAKISVNQTTGVSVVRYVGTGVATTVGHGQNQALDFMFVKAVNAVLNWPVYHRSIGAGNYLVFNGTALSTADTSMWNNTNPTSSVFSIGTNTFANTNGTTYIAYCFSSIPGFSSFGTYAANGSTDGNFIYTGFLPRYAIFKRTDNVSLTGWMSFNGASQTYNAEGPYFFVESTGAEGATAAYVDFVSNGIKQRSTNANLNAASTNYVYMAWAESPFKYSLAR